MLVEGEEHPESPAAMRKKNSKAEEHNELPRDPLGEFSFLNSPHQNSSTQLRSVKTCNTSNHRHRRHMGKACDPHAAASATTGNSGNRSVSTGLQFDEQ
jgi:hypothetical protein